METYRQRNVEFALSVCRPQVCRDCKSRASVLSLEKQAQLSGVQCGEVTVSISVELAVLARPQDVHFFRSYAF